MFFIGLNGLENQNKKPKKNENIKQDLLNLLKENDDVENQRLKETTSNVNKSQEAIVIKVKKQ